MDPPLNSPSALSQPGHSKLVTARQVATNVQPSAILSRLVRRLDENGLCSNDEACGRIISPNVTHIAIALGVILPVIVAGITFYFLHRRSVKRMHMEDAKYRETGLDYGLEESPSKGKRLTAMLGADKQHHKPGQLSMDMNLSSPYLLPPSLNQSRDSLHSLTKTYTGEKDPYHTVPLYSSSGDGASIRSFTKGPSPPLRSNNNNNNILAPRFQPKAQSQSPLGSISPASSETLSTPAYLEPAHIAAAEATSQVPHKNFPVQPIVPEIRTIDDSRLDEQSLYDIPDVASPPAAVAKDSHTGLPIGGFQFELPVTTEPESSSQIVSPLSFDLPTLDTPGEGFGGFEADVQTPVMSPESMYGQRGRQNPMDDGHSNPLPRIQTNDPVHRRIGDNSRQDFGQGLGVPQNTVKRVSMGVVPLPPDEVTQSEDPEYRANRIRSFYKEYFEDYADAPPLPGQASSPDDYDTGYLGDAAYYDADSNTFVMPYAQPVTRRAMTPPPGGARRGLPGPGRPRGPSSIGGMSLPGGRGRMRAGSTGAFGRGPGPAKKKLPAPSALNTLPTPAKLRDDTALINAMDFAPPESFKDQAAGRCQSPLGERRPYKAPMHAAASPLATAYDDLAVLPSPHMLRKSSAFTGLDFAPPKKFKDSDTMSDAGSIRSNRSAISAAQLGAIRSGAGRVSRLPGDTIFTASTQMDQLKPQWGMRQ